jgi:predicted porin
MIIKNLLLSTVLTAAVSLSTVASAADVANQPSKVTKAQHKKVAHKDDAYSPKQHNAPAAMPQQTETMMIFAEVNEPKKHDQKQHDHQDNNGLAVTVGGKVDVQYGFTSQRLFFKNSSNQSQLAQSDEASPNRMPIDGSDFTNQNAMVSNGEITVRAEKTVDACQKYGLEIASNANTSPSSSGNPNFASRVFIYLENAAGRFEVGANDGVNSTLALGAAKIAKGTGGIDGDYSSWIPYTAVGGANNEMLNDTFLTSPALPYAAYNQRKANKITYYTPTYNGFKGGLSYVRDATVQGTVYEALSFKGDGYQNVVEGGISYESKFNDMSLGLSLNGQIGEARDAFINSTPIPLKKLGAWEVGGQISYDAFTFAASYGDWDTSGTLKNVAQDTPSKKANFWTTGLAYDYQDKGGMSVTYMQSERRGAFAANGYNYINSNQATFDGATNKYEALSVGGEYKVMPGLMPYAEFTSFDYTTPLSDIKTNKGSVVLAGVKLNF